METVALSLACLLSGHNLEVTWHMRVGGGRRDPNCVPTHTNSCPKRLTVKSSLKKGNRPGRQCLECQLLKTQNPPSKRVSKCGAPEQLGSCPLRGPTCESFCSVAGSMGHKIMEKPRSGRLLTATISPQTPFKCKCPAPGKGLQQKALSQCHLLSLPSWSLAGGDGPPAF